MNVVASTFGSPAWAGILPHARALADVLEAELTVLHIDAAADRGARPGAGEASSVVDTVRAIEPGAAVQVSPQAAAADGVVSQVTKATGAAVVAMHAQPASAVQEVVGGGVAAKVLEHAPVPVLLGGGALEPPRLPYRLLIAVDDSDRAERAIQAISDLLASSRVPIGLVTSYFDTLGDGPVNAEARDRRERLEALAQRLPAGVQVDVMVESNHGLETIQGQVLAAAERWGASAIAVAHQHRGRLSQALAGSTSLAMLRKSPVPLLFVPPARPGPSPRSVGRSEIELQGWRSVSQRGLIPRERSTGIGL